MLMVRYDETGKNIRVILLFIYSVFLYLMRADTLHIGGIGVQMLHIVSLSSLGHI